MNAKIQNLPVPWNRGASHIVTVVVSEASPGTSVRVVLVQTDPPPQNELGEQTVNVDNGGRAIAHFTVVLSTPGINVLHSVATRLGNFASDSAGTIVQ